MKTILSKFMSSLKFEFEEEKNIIKYEEYFFNVCFIPKNIEINYLSNNSLNINWNIDKINEISLDKNKIKYIVEIKKENEVNEIFKKVYEGNKNSCSINNLINNTNYELRIYSLYNGLIGGYSQIKKIYYIENIDSIILKETKKNYEFLRKIYEWIGNKKMELIFRGTKDGKNKTSFHNKCDNKGANIC